MKEKKNLITFVLILIIIALLICVIIFNFIKNAQVNNEISTSDTTTNTSNINNKENENIEIKNSELSNFDLSFLKMENQKENKVYSPLSIKYALKMLEEGANGETKSQISKLIGEYNLTTYESNENFSLANALFVRDSFKNQIKESYINTLKSKYNAEIKFDLFENSTNINNWINEKTYKIIPNIITDDVVGELDFALINALAIDMEWEEKFIMGRLISTEFLHEKRSLSADLEWEEITKRNINVYDIDNVSSNTFKNGDNEIEVSGMCIYATINNYDILNELGEDNIKKIVADEYRKFAKNEPYDTEHAYGDFPLSEDTSDAGIEKDLNEFLPNYISELNSNYHKSGSSTDFSVYTDEDVKIFAKDLKEYDNTTLQYVGIMPISTDLDKFITDLDGDTVNNYISNLKDISYENFKEGVVTRIFGYIPKFKFEYDLNLMEDLKSCNITNVFDSKKSDLSNMINGDAYISTALHKANIEFTQDGIKAAAATFLGGAGAGSPFDYQFDVPVEEIDITFDKPYMFLIRDKETGEIWFTGTVYEPLLWEEEPEKENVY